MSTDTKVKERPILFSGPMVRAILDGRKTQTRRVLKDQPTDKLDGRWSWIASSSERSETGKFQYSWPDLDGNAFTIRGREQAVRYRCPYGSVGERLWVRETWMPFDYDHRPPSYAYRADVTQEGEDLRKEYVKCGRQYQWRPSIHMPRKASRITLEITGVRIERLNDIDLADCIAEGIEWKYRDDKTTHWRDYSGLDVSCTTSAYFSYQTLWESINGPLSWSLNPWVWVVEFKRIENL